MALIVAHLAARDVSLAATSGCRTQCRASHESVAHVTNRWRQAVRRVVTNRHGLVSDIVTAV
jgi:hypothetical protein